MSASSEWKIGIVGASGELGRRIVDTLAFEPQVQIIATSRDISQLTEFEAFPNVELRQLDLDFAIAAARTLRDCELVIFCPILTLSYHTAAAMREIGSDARFILFSSNNVGLDEEAEIYVELAETEEKVSEMALPWALIRPTMIYGAPDDGNLGRLIRLARSLPLLPMPGRGKGLQQPIHYDDLAALVASLALDMEWRRLEIGAAGPEACSLSELYKKVIRASGRKRGVLPVPVGLLAGPVRLLERMGLSLPVRSAQLQRVDMDKLPSWPRWEGWEPEIDLESGLADIAEQLDEISFGSDADEG